MTDNDKLITWLDAVETWGRLTQNRIEWFKLNQTFHKLWGALDRKLSCNECTRDVLAAAMSEVVAGRDDQKRCAEFMLQSLIHAHAEHPEQCAMPLFTSYELVNTANEMAQDRYMGRKPQSADPLPKDEVEEQPAEEPKDESKKLPVRIRRKVVCLDAKTLKPCREFTSIKEASNATGSTNIARAIQKHTMAGGYFWCDKGQEKNFQPQVAQTGRPSVPKSTPAVAKAKKPTPNVSGPKGKVNTMAKGQPTLSEIPDEDLVAELRRRGYNGTITQTIIRTIEI